MNIAKTKHTSQYINNMSFDDQLKVSMVEIIGADGFLRNVGEVNYDTTSVDMADPENIIVTYLLNSVLVATETITKSGTTWNIVKT